MFNCKTDGYCGKGEVSPNEGPEQTVTLVNGTLALSFLFPIPNPPNVFVHVVTISPCLATQTWSALGFSQAHNPTVTLSVT